MDRRQFIASVAAGAAITAGTVLIPASVRAQTTRIRRNVMTMTADDPFFADYAQGVTLMHQLPSTDQRNWRNQSLIHLNHCPHAAIDFVHWHRHYISYYEQIIGQLIGKPSFALPYWDWSNGVGVIPNPFYDLPPLNVAYWKDPSNAQSDNWGPDEVTTVGIRVLRKGVGVQQGSTGGAFTPAKMTEILSQTVFANFTNMLETAPHNNGHVAVGGSRGHMGDGMSPLDPIFWLHHCMVDYMWAKWQGMGNTTPALDKNYSGQFVTATGAPATNVTSANALYYPAMGYQYEGLTPLPQTSVVASSKRQLRAAAPAVALAATTSEAVVSAPSVTSMALTSASSSSRRMLSSANTIGGAKLLATISATNAPTISPMIINVFVNKPDATAATPYTDPHFAGSFSFFGGHRGHLMDMDFKMDLTKAVAAVGGDAKNLSVQLVPVLVDEVTVAPPTFTVRSIKISGN